MTSLPHLLLLRTPISPLSQDQYAIRFPPLSTHHVPVLSTTFVNLDDLAAIVAKGGVGIYSGVVVTSGRSVRAWEMAAASVKEGKGKGKDRERTPERGTETETGWEPIPFFVVGPGTRDGLLRMETPPSRKIYGAEDSGSGIKLAEFVIDYFVKEREGRLGRPEDQDEAKEEGSEAIAPKSNQLPLLYLVGDKNRPTLPRLLSLAQIPIQKFQVYSTCACPTFLDDLIKVFDSIEAERVREGKEKKVVWIVMFSPSGSGNALSTMREIGLIAASRSSTSPAQTLKRSPYPSLTLKFAAIGPTTLQYLEEDEGISVSATAASPDAIDLEHTIREVEERDEIEASRSEDGSEEEEEVGPVQEKARWEKSWNWLLKDIGGIGI